MQLITIPFLTIPSILHYTFHVIEYFKIMFEVLLSFNFVSLLYIMKFNV